MPPPGEYLSAMQRDGKPLGADEIYNKVYAWLTRLGCEKFVNPQAVEQYAMTVSRWIHCEEVISKTGYIAKHPTISAPIASPYVAMSQSYLKQANICWNQIFTVVRENCSTEFQGNPQDDLMEQLLRRK